MKPRKRSVAVVVRESDTPHRILTVLRPDDDEDLPATWGLPAATLRPGETWEDAARRTGREKLGVRLRLEGEVGEDRVERAGYELLMKEFEAIIVEGVPQVPQPVEGVTRYQDWEWASPERLVPAARDGSLCSRIYLRSRDRSW